MTGPRPTAAPGLRLARAAGGTSAGDGTEGSDGAARHRGTGWADALASLAAVRYRPEVIVAEEPAPARLAPDAVALGADLEVAPRSLLDLSTGSGDPDDGAAVSDVVGSGRLVVLHDPAGHESWGGTLRVVLLAKVEVDPEVAADPLLTEVGWTWLTDALTGCGAEHRHLSGTVTRTASQSYGALEHLPAAGRIEVRASWSPADYDLGAHAVAWVELLCAAAGLPPLDRPR